MAEGILSRFKTGLRATRDNFVGGLARLVPGRHAIDESVLEELEERLLMADVGIEATTRIVDHLRTRVARRQLADTDALLQALREELIAILTQSARTSMQGLEGAHPAVVLIVGVNGVGKTTTLGKLARYYQAQSHSVVLAAGDTFRAAAVEQLQRWGERIEVPVIAQGHGADAAAVLFDALQSAQARGQTLLLCDTAGRLHNKAHLMDELGKIRRVMQKLDAKAPHEVLLVVDATTGQNALAQARQFNETMPLTGLVLTKLDGTARGGIAFALCEQLKLPICFVGLGEGVEDLRPFEAEAFVEALLSD